MGKHKEICNIFQFDVYIFVYEMICINIKLKWGIFIKKLLIATVVVLAFTGCSSGKTDEVSISNVSDVAGMSDLTKVTGSDDIIGNGKTNNASKSGDVYEELSDEEILNELKGMYVNSDYIDTFGKTRSVESVYKVMRILNFHKSGNEYYIMPGDGHQGSENLKINGKRYSLEFVSDYTGICADGIDVTS